MNDYRCESAAAAVSSIPSGARTRSSEIIRKHQALRLSFTLIGQTVHVDEFDRRVRAFLRKHDVDEAAITATFAKRLASPCSRLLAAMLPIYES